jgi:membrane protease YdiL (CAAX protease family)
MAEPGILIGADGRVRSGWRVAAFALGFFVVAHLLVGTVVGVVIVVILMACTGKVDIEAVERMARSFRVAMLVGMVTLPPVMGLAWFFRRYLDWRTYRSLGFWWDRLALRDLLLGAAMGSCLVVLTALLAVVPGGCAWRPQGLMGGGGGLVLGLLLAFVGLAAAALVEEIVCRSYIQGNLTETIGPLWAILISSAVFSFFHLMNPNMSWLPAVNLFVAGVLLGLVYHRFRSIWAVWAMHFAWNFTMGPVLGVPVSGVNMPSLLELELSPTRAELYTGGEFGFEGGLIATGVMGSLIIGLAVWEGRPERPPERLPPKWGRDPGLGPPPLARVARQGDDTGA